MAELDLNLLRVFDALHELRSVTRAAARLGLTQSAISHALGRLRNAVGDPLFHRGPGGLQPTARAQEMAPGVREGLAQLRGALAPSLFDPATAERTFTLCTGSYFSLLLSPRLVARVRAEAPLVTLNFMNPSLELLAALDDGTVDVVLGSFDRVPARLLSEPLFQDRFVWIAARDNPILNAPDVLQRIVQAPRVEIIVGRPPGLGPFAMTGGLEWRVGVEGDSPGSRRVTVSDAVAAARLVAETDLVARIPRQFALRAAAPGRIAVVEDPADGEMLGLGMVSHRRVGSDAGVTWLRALIHDLAPRIIGE